MQYDPIALSNHYRQRPQQVWRRRLTITNEFSSFGMSLTRDWVGRRVGPNQRQRARKFCEKLTGLGATFIKLGQILSCRPDLMPPLYIEELANLQDQLPPFDNAIAHSIINSELGRHYSEVFAELSPHPVAAASLGQVYKGKLQSGETVAVKVQRPGLVETISLDIYILRRLAARAQRAFSVIRSDLVALIDELAAGLFEEMDYTQEASNAERFANLYGDMENITAPGIYWQYTKGRVLTMEWIDGIKLTDLETMRSLGLDPSEFIELAFQCSLRQLLEEGFFHADPHPGNLLATADGKLAYLDFGMMSQVSSDYRDRLLISIVHIVVGDFEGLTGDYVKLGFLPAEADFSGLAVELADVFGGVMGSTVAEYGIKRVIEKLSPLIFKYPFELPTYYLLIFRSLATLEGLTLRIEPDLLAFNRAYSYVADRLLAAPSAELKSCLQDLLLKGDRLNWEFLADLWHQAQMEQQGSNEEIYALLDRFLEFLYSPEGDRIRIVLIREIVTNLEMPLDRGLERIALAMGLTPATHPVNINSSSEKVMGEIWDTVVKSAADDLELTSKIFWSLLWKPKTQSLMGEITGEIGNRASTVWERWWEAIAPSS